MTAADRRRVWHALAWATGLFVAGQLGLALHLETAGTAARDPEFAAKLARLRAASAARPEQPLLLMLGSSRTLQGFQAERCDGLTLADGRAGWAFNFGLTGAGPLRQWLALRQLDGAGVRPAALLVEILPPLLNAPGDGRLSEEAWLVPGRLRATDLYRLRPYLDRPDRFWSDWGRARWLPAVSHRRPLLDEFLPGWNPSVGPPQVEMDDRGWRPFRMETVPAADRARLTALVAEQYAPAYHDFRLAGGPAAALRDLLAFGREQRVPVVLVRLPEASVFRAWGVAVQGPLGAFLAELQQSGPCGLIDARDWVPDDGFWDGHHLLPGGARIFSARLRTELTCGGWLAPPTGERN